MSIRRAYLRQPQAVHEQLAAPIFRNLLRGMHFICWFIAALSAVLFFSFVAHVDLIKATLQSMLAGLLVAMIVMMLFLATNASPNKSLHRFTDRDGRYSG
jgi:hypothetical protein